MRSRLILAAAAASATLALVSSARADWLVKTYIDPYIWNLGTADAIIGGAWGSSPNTVSLSEWNTADNAADPGGGGVFNPNFQSPASGDNFAVQGSGNIIVAAAGDYRFYNNTDDGSRLRIDGGTVILDDVLSGDHDASGVIHLNAGVHSIQWTWFEYFGGAQGEVSYENLTTAGTGRQLLGMAGTPGSANGVTLDAAAVVKGYQSSVSGVTIDNLTKALTMAGDPSKKMAEGLYPVMNATQNDDDGRFLGGYTPPGLLYPRPPDYPANDDDDYVVTGTGFLHILLDGDYKFAQLTDDGGALRLDGTPIIVDDSLHGAGYPGDVKYSPVLHLTAGYHFLEHLFFERGGGASGEVFLVDPISNEPIALVGDVAHGGLEVTQTVPEPGILSVLALGSVFALRRRRNGQL